MAWLAEIAMGRVQSTAALSRRPNRLAMPVTSNLLGELVEFIKWFGAQAHV